MSTETERHTIQQSRNGEKGMALVVALLAIMVLTGIGFALMLSSSTEGLIHGNFRQSGLALYAARAGVEEARGRMGPDLGFVSPAVPPVPPIKICGYAEPPGPLPTGCPTTTPDTHLPNVTTGLYIRLNNTIDPRDASCTYQGVAGACYDPETTIDGLTTINYPPTAQTGTQIPYVWVKITLATQLKLNRNLLDPGDLSGLDNTQVVCVKGKNLILDTGTFPSAACGDPPNPAYIMTALAIEPGGARRIVREIGALSTTPPLPGGLVFDSPCDPITGSGTVTYPPPVSNPYEVSGEDVGGGTDVHAVVVGCPADVAIIQNLISDGNKCAPVGFYPTGCQSGPNRNTDYPGVGNNNCSGNNCNYPGSINGADIFDGSALLAANDYFKDCDGVQSMVDNIKGGADFTYPSGTTNIPTPGTTANPVVNVITGNATLGQADFGTPGSGIMLIEGNLVLNGYPNYRGVILIIGTGSVEIAGGGNGVVEGGIFLANTSTCSTTGELGPTIFNNDGGGTFQIEYNSDYVNPKKGYLPVQRISENY